MNAKELFHAGRLDDAVQALVAELRNDPANDRQRTFLFELLCLSGAWDRAEKQLDVLSRAGGNTELGALLYRGALAAERTRERTFEGELSESDVPAPSGSLNDQPFEWVSDADPRIGPKLEVFAAGAYMWIPFAQIDSIEIPAPRRLRDLIWTPAVVHTGPEFQDKDLGEVLLPVLCPLSSRSTDDQVRLGRVTVWQESPAGAIPLGRKVIIVDDEEIPLLEARRLRFGTAEGATAPAGSGAAG